jgi:hypothetical protein
VTTTGGTITYTLTRTTLSTGGLGLTVSIPRSEKLLDRQQFLWDRAEYEQEAQTFLVCLFHIRACIKVVLQSCSLFFFS